MNLPDRETPDDMEIAFERDASDAEAGREREQTTSDTRRMRSRMARQRVEARQMLDDARERSPDSG